VLSIASEAGFTIDGGEVVALDREGICTREVRKFAELLRAQPPAGGGLPKSQVEKLVMSMVPNRDYLKGWNDCVDAARSAANGSKAD
jgi:hypothetical protein